MAWVVIEPELDPELPMGATIRTEEVLTTGDGSRGLYVKRDDPSNRVIPVEKVACVYLIGYQARRRAIFAGERHTPRVTEATFQDRLGRSDALLPQQPEKRSSTCECWRSTGMGERFKPWRSVVAESWNETFKDWPIEGSLATLAFAKHIARPQQSSTAWFETRTRSKHVAS